MAKQTISVLISTCNRPSTLARCLDSLVRQTKKPVEVIVVDNGPSDDTQYTCRAFTKKLPLRYAIEKRKGLSYGRNKGIALARGQICAFLDDDCVAAPDWIDAIGIHFQKYDYLGVIGKNLPLFPDNIPGRVEDVFFYRRLIQSAFSVNRVSTLHSSSAIDFKNAAFLTRFIKKYRFDTNILLPIEDVEMGIRLYRASQNICFDPSVVVCHENSSTYSGLFKKNYIKGYAMQAFFKKPMELNKKNDKLMWYKYIGNTTNSLTGLQNKIVFIFVLLIYPWFSRFGRLSYILHHK